MTSCKYYVISKSVNKICRTLSWLMRSRKHHFMPAVWKKTVFNLRCGCLNVSGGRCTYTLLSALADCTIPYRVSQKSSIYRFFTVNEISFGMETLHKCVQFYVKIPSCFGEIGRYRGVGGVFDLLCGSLREFCSLLWTCLSILLWRVFTVVTLKWSIVNTAVRQGWSLYSTEHSFHLSSAKHCYCYQKSNFGYCPVAVQAFLVPGA